MNRGGCEKGDGLSKNVLDAILQPKNLNLSANHNESILSSSCAKLNSSSLMGSKKSLHFASDTKEFYKSHGQRWIKAIRRREVGRVREMLEEKPELVHYTPLHGVTSMHLAVACADRTIILLLLSKGADIDIRDAAGYTCLQKSILLNNVSLAHFLISQGAKMDLRDAEGLTIEDYEQWTELDDESARRLSNSNCLRTKAASIADAPSSSSSSQNTIRPSASFNRILKSRPASTPDAPHPSASEPDTELKRGKLRGSWKSFFIDATKK